jgi:hypothetical protein
MKRIHHVKQPTYIVNSLASTWKLTSFCPVVGVRCRTPVGGFPVSARTLLSRSLFLSCLNVKTTYFRYGSNGMGVARLEKWKLTIMPNVRQNDFLQEGSEYDQGTLKRCFIQIIFHGDRSAPLRWLDRSMHRPAPLGQDARFLWSMASTRRTWTAPRELLR